jgi:hypothetical protein
MKKFFSPCFLKSGGWVKLNIDIGEEVRSQKKREVLHFSGLSNEEEQGKNEENFYGHVFCFCLVLYRALPNWV